ncbi:MAG: hypothetical protein IJR89_06595 [Clostridia bacterium]|nr:hypothetical protein [Clostridia bacterium]
MRNPARIKPFCDKLQKYWKEKIPDWRFGQFMSNFLGWVVQETGRDIFFTEDNEMTELLDKFFAENV